jgi:hypothetical protein
MDQSKIPTMFKSKANELVNQLKAKFPALMFLPSLKTMDGIEMITTYKETVSKPYHDRIVEKDETFFLNVSDKDIMQAAKKADTSVDVSMLSMIRALWKDLGDEDKEVVWGFFTIFERLVEKWNPSA